MANLVRRDPFREMLDRVFDGGALRPFLNLYDEEGMLPLDISQTEDELIVRASLPGFNREDIEVLVENGVLSIKAERSESEKGEKERFYRRERWEGSLSRRVALPGIVSESEAKAELKDGVLEVRIPVSEKAKPKKLEIC